MDARFAPSDPLTQPQAPNPGFAGTLQAAPMLIAPLSTTAGAPGVGLQQQHLGGAYGSSAAAQQASIGQPMQQQLGMVAGMPQGAVMGYHPGMNALSAAHLQQLQQLQQQQQMQQMAGPAWNQMLLTPQGLTGLMSAQMAAAYGTNSSAGAMMLQPVQQLQPASAPPLSLGSMGPQQAMQQQLPSAAGGGAGAQTLASNTMQQQQGLTHELAQGQYYNSSGLSGIKRLGSEADGAGTDSSAPSAKRRAPGSGISRVRELQQQADAAAGTGSAATSDVSNGGRRGSEDSGVVSEGGGGGSEGGNGEGGSRRRNTSGNGNASDNDGSGPGTGGQRKRKPRKSTAAEIQDRAVIQAEIQQLIRDHLPGSAIPRRSQVIPPRLITRTRAPDPLELKAKKAAEAEKAAAAKTLVGAAAGQQPQAQAQQQQQQEQQEEEEGTAGDIAAAAAATPPAGELQGFGADATAAVAAAVAASMAAMAEASGSNGQQGGEQQQTAAINLGSLGLESLAAALHLPIGSLQLPTTSLQQLSSAMLQHQQQQLAYAGGTGLPAMGAQSLALAPPAVAGGSDTGRAETNAALAALSALANAMNAANAAAASGAAASGAVDANAAAPEEAPAGDDAGAGANAGSGAGGGGGGGGGGRGGGAGSGGGRGMAAGLPRIPPNLLRRPPTTPAAAANTAAAAAASPGAAAGADTGAVNGTNAQHMSDDGGVRAARGPRAASKYIGVTWRERIQRWEVYVWASSSKKSHYIGAFPTAIDAARAYDVAVLWLMGQDARPRTRLNFPITDYNLEEIQAEASAVAAMRQLSAQN